jgi:cytochrome c2
LGHGLSGVTNRSSVRSAGYQASDSLKDGGARFITADALRAYIALLKSEAEAA